MYAFAHISDIDISGKWWTENEWEWEWVRFFSILGSLPSSRIPCAWAAEAYIQRATFINNRNGKMKGPSFSSCCRLVSHLIFLLFGVACVQSIDTEKFPAKRKNSNTHTYPWTSKGRLEYDMFHFMRMAFGINLYMPFVSMYTKNDVRCAFIRYSHNSWQKRRAERVGRWHSMWVLLVHGPSGENGACIVF